MEPFSWFDRRYRLLFILSNKNSWNGDGGFLTYKKLYEKIRLRFYGIDTLNKNKKWSNKYYSIDHGVNSRLLQASNLKMKYINLIAQKYFMELKGPDIEILNKKNFCIPYICRIQEEN